MPAIVTPAQAGVQSCEEPARQRERRGAPSWAPAFAGVTVMRRLCQPLHQPSLKLRLVPLPIRCADREEN